VNKDPFKEEKGEGGGKLRRALYLGTHLEGKGGGQLAPGGTALQGRGRKEGPKWADSRQSSSSPEKKGGGRSTRTVHRGGGDAKTRLFLLRKKKREY